MTTLKQKLPPIQHIIAIEIILILTVATFFLPGGDDLYRFYRPLSEGCLQCGYNPWHTYWILFPLQFIPLRFLWPIWTLITGLGTYWAMRQLGTNPVWPLLSFPMIGLIWLGQTDVLLIVGFTLALISKNPYARGFGLLLLSIKPQVAGPAILLLLIRDEDRLKTLIIPTVVLVISLIVWGITWPLQWLTYIFQNPVSPVWVQAVLFPVGLLAFLAVPLFKEKRDQLAVVFIATALGFPRFATYSYILFLVLIAPWWSLPLSYAWLLAWPIMHNTSMRLAWVLPLGILIYMLLPRIRAWIDSRRPAPSLPDPAT